MKFRNPFGFWSVIGLAAVLAAVIILGRMLGETFGAVGTIIGAMIAGLADVDAIAVSAARLAPAPLTPQEASYAILAAVASNTAVKVGIGAVIGRGRFAVEVGLMAILCFAAAGLALALPLAALSG